MNQHPLSDLQLYGHVIAAYKKAAVWPLHKYAYERTGHKLRAEKWTWISIFSLVIITIFTLAFLDNMDVLNTTTVNIIRLIGIAVLILIGFRENKIREKAFKLVFSEDISKYGVMVKEFGAGFQFYRYILFRDEMEKLPEKPITVEPLKDLFDPTSAPVLKTCFSINALPVANWFRHHRFGGSRTGFVCWEAPGKRGAG